MLERKLTLAVSALAAVGLWTCVFVAPPAAAVPLVEFYVDGDLHSSYTCASVQFDCISGKEDLFSLSLSDPGGTDWTVSITAVLDPDPYIDYTASANDIGAANTFGFIFLQDIVSVLAPGAVTHTYSAGTSDGEANGVLVTPGAPPAGIPTDPPGTTADEISVFTLSTDGGATYLNAGLDLGPAFSGAAGGADTHGDFDEAGPGPAGTGSYTKMRVDVNFGLAGGGDTYSLGGLAVVVPEPMSIGLLGLGIAALGFVGRRRS